MQLIIDIPDEDYKFIKDLQFYHSGRRSGRTIEQNVINGIRNGTPLPKGHGRLKDIDKVEQLLDLDKPDNAIAKALKNIIESVPTLIEADRGEENERQD